MVCVTQLLKNRAYLVLLLCFASGVGVFTCFTTLLDQILCVQGYTNVSLLCLMICKVVVARFDFGPLCPRDESHKKSQIISHKYLKSSVNRKSFSALADELLMPLLQVDARGHRPLPNKHVYFC